MLSKKDVPASVGDPASNPIYWTQTGFYNGQITFLQDQIDNLRANKTIMIFDSYGTKYPTPTGDTLGEYMRSYSGLSSDELMDFAYSGSGFVANGGLGTFLSRFTTDSAGITNKDDIKTIFVAAGRNDWQAADPDTLVTAIGSFVSYCKTNYPNARILVTYVGNGDNTASSGTRVEQYLAYVGYRRSGEVGATYIPGGEAILKYPPNMDSDYSHPSIAGRQALANYLLQGLVTGNINVKYLAQPGTITFDNTVVGASNVSFPSYIENNMSIVTGNDVAYIQSVYLAIQASAGTFTSIKIGHINTNNCLIAYPVNKLSLPYEGFLSYDWADSVTPSTTPNDDISFNISVDAEGDVYLDMYAKTGHNLALIYFKRSDRTYPSVNC